jgi:aspartate/methionine/tyrosine aminotransferase
MSDDMKLAKLDLGPDWIDLSYGEPVIVREILKTFIEESSVDYSNLSYPLANGYKPLTEVLEKKYNAKVVIANGAKQGLSATFYALKKMGHKSLMIHKPYWVSTPNLIRKEGLDVRFIHEHDSCGAFMLTSPNNPDGRELTSNQMIDMHEDAKLEKVKLIHDAAYYTPIYVRNPGEILTSFGDVQIYSASKMWGLSGLRVGYVVCHNEEFYDLTAEYIEAMTSGVSIASQEIAFDVENQFQENKGALIDFHNTCRTALQVNKELLKQLDPEVLEPVNLGSGSMFVWCKKGPKLDYKAAKVHMIEGELFGAGPGMVRLNVAMRSGVIADAVARLNAHKI